MKYVETQFKDRDIGIEFSKINKRGFCWLHGIWWAWTDTCFSSCCFSFLFSVWDSAKTFFTALNWWLNKTASSSAFIWDCRQSFLFWIASCEGKGFNNIWARESSHRGWIIYKVVNFVSFTMCEEVHTFFLLYYIDLLRLNMKQITKIFTLFNSDSSFSLLYALLLYFTFEIKSIPPTIKMWLSSSLNKHIHSMRLCWTKLSVAYGRLI